MTAEFLDPPAAMNSGLEGGDLTFVSRTSSPSYLLKLDNGARAYGDAFTTRVEFNVLEFRDEYKPTREYVGPVDIHVAFGFPLTSVSVEKTPILHHHAFGLLRGDLDRDSGEIDLMHHPMVLQSSVGELKIAEEFCFHRNDWASQFRTVGTRSYVGIGPVRIEPNELDTRLDAIRETVELLFECVSVVERDRLNWHHERVIVNGADGDFLSSRSTQRWVSPPTRDSVKDRHSFQNAQKDSRKTLIDIFAAYERATPDVKIVVRKLINAMKIAYTMPVFEAQFIHWHSCLDFFKKVYGVQNVRGFSRALVRMFDQTGIAIDDLLSADQLQEIRRANNNQKVPMLPFTALRNSYIHEGFDVFQNRFAEGWNRLVTMRALVERLLLNQLGISYQDTSLGRVDTTLYPPFEENST